MKKRIQSVLFCTSHLIRIVKCVKIKHSKGNKSTKVAIHQSVVSADTPTWNPINDGKLNCFSFWSQLMTQPTRPFSEMHLINYPP
ncbi:MAG: hypothetical protein LBK82_14730 [Planctomycetaceae bacterium]|nr:hypothetical protein [Planctomycetaceae bacterium]